MPAPGDEMGPAPVRPPRRAAGLRGGAGRPPDADGNAPGPVRWTPPIDGILRGPPLSRDLPEDSLGLLLLTAMQNHGDREALVDAVTGESMTYRDLVRESVCLARALRLLVKHLAGQNDTEVVHDVVGVFVENRKELVPSLIANLMMGVPVTMLNHLANTGELVRAWTVTRPSVTLCSWRTLPAVLEASRSLPSVRHVVVFPGDAADDVSQAAKDFDAPASLNVVAYTSLLSKVPREGLQLDGYNEDLVKSVGDVLRTVNTHDHIAYLLQCGPGGRFARLTHRNLIYTVQLLLEPDAAGYGWTSDDVLLLGAPLSHAFGLGICLGALTLGLKVVVMTYFREQLFLSAVQAHEVSQLVLVPRQALLLAHSPLLEDAAVVEGLRRGGGGGLRGVVCAAAPLPRAMHRDLTRRLAAPCRQAYGLTQASCSLLVAPHGAPLDTQGRVVPGAEAKVVGAAGETMLGPLQVGELLLRAPSIMAGYLDRDVVRDMKVPVNPNRGGHATADGGVRDSVDADGWLRTGDLAYYDCNGCVFVVDRLKDVTLYTRGHFKEFDVEHGAAEAK